MTELPWQRPSAIALVFFVFRQLKLLVSNVINFIPIFSALVITGITLKSVLLISLAYLAVIIIAAILSYRYFAFAVHADTLHVRSGIFNRQQLTLKFARIQQAEIKQPWYFRPFKLTTMRVDSAGSSAQEIEIPGLTLHAAQQLRLQLLSDKPTAVSSDTEIATAITPLSSDRHDHDYRHKFSPAELLRGGFMDNKIWLLLALLMYPLIQLNFFENHLVPWLEQQSLVWGQTYIVTLMLTLSVGIILLLMVGLVMTLISDYGLTLTIGKGRFHAQAGLLTIRSLSFRYHKLQRVVFKQNLRGRLLKRQILVLNQLRPTRRNQAQQPLFKLPVLDQQLVMTMRHSLRLPNPTQLSWCSLPLVALLGPTIMLALLAITVSSLGVVIARHGVISLQLITAAWMVLQLWLVARWWRYGYAYDGHWLVVKQGVFSHRERWYPLHKIQQINVNQSPWQRLLQLVSVQVISAVGQEHIRWQSAATGYALQQQWLSAIHTSQQSWI